MTAITSNYISSEELTLWLTEKQNEIYGDMRDAIDMSNERSQMQSELATIKQHLEEANASGDFEKVSQEIGAFWTAHADHPDFEEVSGPLGEINASISAYYQDKAHDEAYDEALDNAPWSAGDGPAFIPDVDELDLPLHYSTEQLKTWTDAIGSKIEFLGQQDQLSMIRIQELNGKVNQSEQLVSNLLASQNQTQNAVISNIRG